MDLNIDQLNLLLFIYFIFNYLVKFLEFDMIN